MSDKRRLNISIATHITDHFNWALLVSILLPLFPYTGYSQNKLVELDSNSYFNAISKIEIIHNKNDFIPLVNLRSKKVSTYFENCNYQDALEDEALYFHPVKIISGLSVERDKSDVTIIGIDKESEINESILDSLLAGKNVIVLLFDSTAFKSYPQVMEADVVVAAYENDEVGRRLAVQMVFGGISGNGAQGIRLAYGSAEAMGMDLEMLNNKIDTIADRAISTQACPGMQVLVARKGKVVFYKSYGFHTYDKLQTVQSDDIYDLASVTKVTSVLPALMQLYGQGRFDLNATLADYMPSFSNSNKAELKWRQILAHNARLKPWIPFWRSTLKKNGKYKSGTFKHKQSKRFPIVVTDSLFLHKNYKKKIYRAINKSPLNDEGGFVYSGLAFYLLPEIISNLTSSNFEAYLKREIYERIGAYTMTYNPLRYYSKDRIIPTERDTFFRMTQIHGRVHDEGAAMMDGVSGNAGLFSTANDLAKLAQLYLNRGEYGGESILPAEAVDEFTRCQYCDEGNHRGLGFDKPAWSVDPDATSVSISDKAGPESYGHSGYTGTLMWIDPKEELVFIFLSNRVYQTRLNRKLYTENIRPAIHGCVYDAIIE
jgi:CubicO group peptidase (beta-lactamase class C family)